METEESKRAPIHTTAPDLKLSEAMLAEFKEDLNEAKTSGAVQKAARLAAAEAKVEAAARKDEQKDVQEQEEEEKEPDDAIKFDWGMKAAELKRGGVPIPPGFKGAAKSYTLAAATYHDENSDASSISVLYSI
ncbi:unnamed protein product [Symbiodinium sp. CCMP2592]|nr:unnamed protein product [Symbiodinium sp. CCMP2592]